MSEKFLEINEEERPAIEYMMERVGEVAGQTIVEGRVTSIQVEAKLTRQFAGQYTADKIGEVLTYETSIPCDFIIRANELDVAEAGSTAPIVSEVARRLGRALDNEVYDLMIKHGEQVYAARKAAISVRKEATSEKVSSPVKESY
jgi:hypothetical protein